MKKNLDIFVYVFVAMFFVLLIATMNGCGTAGGGGGTSLQIIEQNPPLDSTKGAQNMVYHIKFNMDMVTFDGNADLSTSFEPTTIHKQITKGEDHSAGTCASGNFYRWETPRIFRAYIAGPLVTTGETDNLVHLVVSSLDDIISTSGKQLAAGSTLWRFTYDLSTETYSISGTCSGGTSGDYIIGVFEEDPANPYAMPPLSGTGEVSSAYTIEGINPGSYYIGAFRDTNGDQRYQANEPWGKYAGNPLTVDGNETGINITVEAP
ncbi:MAG: hypothetical protein NT030_01240 [Candidatus Saganbacteria bacterium]|nr:hypothetical protein [Candidatus Saganbacteria bacterium]